LLHFQQRDLAKQERIWKLEDENADLKVRVGSRHSGTSSGH
jgi:hypothetical protein